ncbi:FhaA domain-containing protein [Catenulispora rubra]|uniref:FhaA domain-containing protein n=1 Tax=Catenulispora rubra TaxID=280293 RepID=UPI001E5A1673
MFDRVERRLDNLISGGFARAFKAELVPADIAAELRRECDGTVVVRGRGRSVAANDYLVQVAPADFTRLAPQAAELAAQLNEAVRAHVQEQRYVLVGPLAVRLEAAEDLAVGVCRVRSVVLPASQPSGPSARRVTAPWLEMNGARIPLSTSQTTLGRGPEADVRMYDPGVSSRHAVIRLGDSATIQDLGSTNGTFVDGRRVGVADLRDGAVIVLGGVRVTFHNA